RAETKSSTGSAARRSRRSLPNSGRAVTFARMNAVQEHAADERPWGWCVTLALTFAAWMLLRWMDGTLSDAVSAIIEALNPGKDANELYDELFGLRFSIVTCLRTVLCVGLVALLIRLRNGPPLAPYLGLRRIGIIELMKWLAAMLVMVL